MSVAKAIKSACSCKKIMADPIKDKTNHIMEWTGLIDVITITAEITVNMAKTGEIIFVIFKEKFPFPHYVTTCFNF